MTTAQQVKKFIFLTMKTFYGNQRRMSCVLMMWQVNWNLHKGYGKEASKHLIVVCIARLRERGIGNAFLLIMFYSGHYTPGIVYPLITSNECFFLVLFTSCYCYSILGQKCHQQNGSWHSALNWMHQLKGDNLKAVKHQQQKTTTLALRLSCSLQTPWKQQVVCNYSVIAIIRRGWD